MASPVMTSLPAYIEERRLPLIVKSVLGAKTANMLTPQSGIKTDAVINLLNTDVVFQDGLTCGFTDAGSQTLTQRTIKTGNIKVNMEYCDRVMLKYWTQYQLDVAAGKERLPFEEEFVDAVIKNIQADVEKAIWQGDTTSEDTQLKWFDGLLKIAGADENVNSVVISGASAYEDIMKVYNAIPAEVISDAVIFVGEDMFRQFTQELIAKNLFHYDGKPSDGELYIPGTNNRVVAVNGLNGSEKIFAARLQDLFIGYDMQGDDEVFDFFYSKDNQAFRLVVKFNVGVNYAWSEFVTLGKKE